MIMMCVLKSWFGGIVALLFVMVSAGSALAQAPGSEAVKPTVDASYRISPNDKLAVTVYEEPDLAAEVSVSSNGMVTLPLIQQVKVLGKTTRQVEMSIAAAYRDQRFLKRPQVTVTVVEFAQRTVSVLGQVNRPGPVLIPGGQERIELLAAIAGAGDFKGIANKRKVRVTRNKGQKGEKSTVVNVTAILNSEKGAQSIFLYPGDFVFVPQRIF